MEFPEGSVLKLGVDTRRRRRGTIFNDGFISLEKMPGMELKKVQDMCVINDPLGQTHSPASSVTILA